MAALQRHSPMNENSLKLIWKIGSVLHVLGIILLNSAHTQDFSRAAEQRACSREGIVQYLAMNGTLHNQATGSECEFDKTKDNFKCIRVAEVQPVWETFQHAAASGNAGRARADFLAQMKSRIYTVEYSLEQTGHAGNRVRYRMMFSGSKRDVPGSAAELTCTAKRSDIHYYAEVKFLSPYGISSGSFLTKGLLREILGEK